MSASELVRRVAKLEAQLGRAKDDAARRLESLEVCLARDAAAAPRAGGAATEPGSLQKSDTPASSPWGQEVSASEASPSSTSSDDHRLLEPEVTLEDDISQRHPQVPIIHLDGPAGTSGSGVDSCADPDVATGPSAEEERARLLAEAYEARQAMREAKLGLMETLQDMIALTKRLQDRRIRFKEASLQRQRADRAAGLDSAATIVAAAAVQVRPSSAGKTASRPLALQTDLLNRLLKEGNAMKEQLDRILNTQAESDAGIAKTAWLMAKQEPGVFTEPMQDSTWPKLAALKPGQVVFTDGASKRQEGSDMVPIERPLGLEDCNSVKLLKGPGGRGVQAEASSSGAPAASAAGVAMARAAATPAQALALARAHGQQRGLRQALTRSGGMLLWRHCQYQQGQRQQRRVRQRWRWWCSLRWASARGGSNRRLHGAAHSGSNAVAAAGSVPALAPAVQLAVGPHHQKKGGEG
eukprot:CAMPEP_0179209492 /NCGR_PEP_ID=MMETSP0796-20121207/104481_1 /TAXON_ID=73915 /ORGANISM="Pyrodinium bahamense, Strain pbaha01" /LENGTH=467 /DNA_ID=CAMNT_0020914451 /DNA_START=54 /DNA_END=1457 /DNA_ORIENTATION=-